MTASLEWRDAAGVALAAAPELVEGATLELQLHVTAGALEGGRLIALEQGDVGLPLADSSTLDNGYVQARITEGIGGAVVSAGDWMAVGGGRWLPLPALAVGEGVELEVRLEPAPAVAATSIPLLLAIDQRVAVPLADPVGVGSGIVVAPGQPQRWLGGGGQVTEDTTEVAVFAAWWYRDRLTSSPDQVLPVVAAAAGMRRYVAVVAGAAGVELVEGAETADAALDTEDEPAYDGELLALASVDETGIYDLADRRELAACAVRDIAGELVTIGPAPLIVGMGYRVHLDAAVVANLGGVDGSYQLYAVRSGGVQVVAAGERPVEAHALLYDAELVGGVASVTDRRRLAGTEGRWSASWAPAAGDLLALPALTEDGAWHPLRALTIQAADAGGAGETTVVLERSVAGVWEAIATATLVASGDHGAAVSGIPYPLRIAGESLRLRAEAVATDLAGLSIALHWIAD